MCSANAEAFAQVCSLAAAGEGRPAPAGSTNGLIPAVVLYSSGNVADMDLVFPPLVAALRQR